MDKEKLKKIFTCKNCILLIFIVITTIFLCTIQFGIYTQNLLLCFGISGEDFVNQFLLNTSHPTIISAFTTNYIHFEYEHLLGNIVVFGMASFFICVVFLIREANEYMIPKIYFIFFAIVAFLFLPFIISFFAYTFPPSEFVFGFSGIVSFCVGACIALLHPCIYLCLNKIQHIQKREKCAQIFAYILVAVLFIATESYLTISDLSSSKNIFVLGHIIGALCGFIFTLVFEGYYKKRHHLHSG